MTGFATRQVHAGRHDAGEPDAAVRRRGILRTEWADGGLRANLRAF